MATALVRERPGTDQMELELLELFKRKPRTNSVTEEWDGVVVMVQVASTDPASAAKEIAGSTGTSTWWSGRLCTPLD